MVKDLIVTQTRLGRKWKADIGTAWFHSALLLVPFFVEAFGRANAVANETEDTHNAPPGNGISARHRPCSMAPRRCGLTFHGAQLSRVLTLLITSSEVFFCRSSVVEQHHGSSPSVQRRECVAVQQKHTFEGGMDARGFYIDKMHDINDGHFGAWLASCGFGVCLAVVRRTPGSCACTSQPC